MILKNTYLIPCDKSGVQLVKVFHLYKGFFRKKSTIGDFVKVSVKESKPNNWILKKTKLKSLIIRTNKFNKRLDSSIFFFFNNNNILLKKRTSSYGKRMIGPILKELNRKKVLVSFKKIL